MMCQTLLITVPQCDWNVAWSVPMISFPLAVQTERTVDGLVNGKCYARNWLVEWIQSQLLNSSGKNISHHCESKLIVVGCWYWDTGSIASDSYKCIRRDTIENWDRIWSLITCTFFLPRKLWMWKCKQCAETVSTRYQLLNHYELEDSHFGLETLNSMHILWLPVFIQIMECSEDSFK